MITFAEHVADVAHGRFGAVAHGRLEGTPSVHSGRSFASWPW